MIASHEVLHRLRKTRIHWLHDLKTEYVMGIIQGIRLAEAIVKDIRDEKPFKDTLDLGGKT